MKQPVICCSPEVMGGTAVFYGTRVPVQTLLDYIEAGDTIDDFLEGFPSGTREQGIAFLEEAKDRLIETVSGGCRSTSASIGGSAASLHDIAEPYLDAYWAASPICRARA